MTNNSNMRTRISGRLEVPELKAKLELLLQKARNPRIRNVASLDRELGFSEEKSFRQYYRSDRPSGVPGEYVELFLALFDLREDQLLMPLKEFQCEIEREHSEDSMGNGCLGGDALPPSSSLLMANPDNVRFAWDGVGVTVDFVPEPDAPEIVARAPTLLNLRRRSPSTVCIKLQSEFRIEVTMRENHCERLLGVIEGSQFNCFQKPFLLQAGPLKLRIPLDGEPFYFDETGHHSLFLFLLSDIRPTAGEIKNLDSEDSRRRRIAVERLYSIACAQGKEPLTVLRADFDVIS